MGGNRGQTAATTGRSSEHDCPGSRKPEAFLSPQHAGGRGVYGLESCWRAVRTAAKLGGLRLHDLRHTAASQAVMSDENLLLVGKLPGHRRHRTTASYAHLADWHLVEAGEKVGGVIAAAMGSSADAPKANSGVRPCTVESADDRLHHRPARRVIARKRT